ncbi:MAG: TIGR00153 family protein [Deltaproteobacteria bacterium]|nr:TIGR00153 family protein [Deltaproteobacteria bacterium]
MFLYRLISQGKKERIVLENIRRHLGLLCTACAHLKDAIEMHDKRLMRYVIGMEKEGDVIRRQIIAHIYEGAFLPYVRPNLCKFVEIVDDVFDLLEDVTSYSLDLNIPERIRGECVRVAHLNRRMIEMLLITFDSFLKGEDLREKTLAIRIYEKKIDEMKFGLFKDVRDVPLKTFWEGRMLFDFINGLTGLSDMIEDASDSLQIIFVSMR